MHPPILIVLVVQLVVVDLDFNFVTIKFQHSVIPVPAVSLTSRLRIVYQMQQNIC